MPKTRRNAPTQAALDDVYRLVQIGLRLNESAGAAELQRVVVEEAAALLGARRVLLVLAAPAGHQLAGARLPNGEDALTLLTAVTPWLDEAHRTQRGSLRHGPEGAAEIDQRSCLVAPLLARQQLLGSIYADLDGVDGRFDHAQREMLATFAAQAAVALAALRVTQDLQDKVAERSTQLEQRAFELAVINRIQQGMAGQLNLQAGGDMADDALTAAFEPVAQSIRAARLSGALAHFEFELDRGHRFSLQPAAIEPDPAVLQQLGQARSTFTASGASALRPSLYASIVVEGRLLGSIVMHAEHAPAEQAFSAAEQRLLTTIASSLGTAL